MSIAHIIIDLVVLLVLLCTWDYDTKPMVILSYFGLGNIFTIAYVMSVPYNTLYEGNAVNQ